MRTSERVKEMYELQENVNSKITNNWRGQGNKFSRCVWVECAEMMDFLQYKWWKSTPLEREAARMELVDIFHFILCCDLLTVRNVEELEDSYFQLLGGRFQSIQVETGDLGADEARLEIVRESVDNLAFAALQDSLTMMFVTFTDLMGHFGMSFDDLYKHYIGKNALNEFRSANGYNEGYYQKEWELPVLSYVLKGRDILGPMEDNEVLEIIIQGLPPETPNARMVILAELARVYEQRI